MPCSKKHNWPYHSNSSHVPFRPHNTRRFYSSRSSPTSVKVALVENSSINWPEHKYVVWIVDVYIPPIYNLSILCDSKWTEKFFPLFRWIYIIFVFLYLSNMKWITYKLSWLTNRPEAKRSMCMSSLAIKLDVKRERIVVAVIIVSHRQTGGWERASSCLKA